MGDNTLKSNLGGFNIPDVSQIDANKLSRSTRGNKGPDFIPYNKRGRDIFGRLSLYTGAPWLGGFTVGGIYGVIEGWKGAANSNYKIRFNSVMNAFSKRGSALGNSLAIVAFVHTLTVYALDEFQVEKYIDSPYTTPILSGVITGGFYKSTRGPRAMVLASLIGGGLSTAVWFGSSYFYTKILKKGGRF